MNLSILKNIRIILRILIMNETPVKNKAGYLGEKKVVGGKKQ
jgi:hypothetical protein